MNADTLHYAGFWPRLLSRILDIIVLLPLVALVIWGSSAFRLFDLYYLLPGTLFGLYFNVYLVRRYGGTPGKLIAGIRIRKLNGEPVGYREAFLRYSVDLAFGLLMSVALFFPLMQMSDAEYHALSFLQRSRRMFELAPAWTTPLQWMQTAWVWGEFLVLLTNQKRRAIHDFIAGTVVVHTNPSPNTAPGYERPPMAPFDY